MHVKVIKAKVWELNPNCNNVQFKALDRFVGNIRPKEDDSIPKS